MNFLNLPQRWLDAESGTTTLHTLPSLMTLCDLQNDNYYKLIAADIPRDLTSPAKIKVFKGSSLVSDQKLQGIPVSVQSLYIDDQDPKVPIIAVAVGPSILFYRNMKPYFKYTLPGLAVEQLEIDVWKKLTIRMDNFQEHIDTLKTLEFGKLTDLSKKLLCIPPEDRESHVKDNIETPLERFNNITAMTKINKYSNDYKSAACLIIGTEAGDILLFDSQTFTIMHQVKVCPYKGTPSLLSATGLYETDYKIVAATMEGTLCLIRKNGGDGSEIAKLDHAASGLVLLPIDQTIAVVCTNMSLMCYSKKGKKLWTAALPAPAMCLTPINLPEVTLICVSLHGGIIQIYLQKHLVDQFYVHDNVAAMTFGKLGREDHVLVLVTSDGSLIIKILKRTAEFSVESSLKTPSEKNKDSSEFYIPKKSSVFVEQTIREKDNLSAIHNAFQTELWRLRLTAARKTVDVINSADSTVSGDIGHSPIKLAAEVLGIGPVYRLFLKIENISERKMADGLSVLLHADHRHYEIKQRFARLPLLIPGIPIKIDFQVSIILDPVEKLPAIDLNSDNSIIKVMVIASGQSRPLIASTVVMPQPEFAFFDE